MDLDDVESENNQIMHRIIHSNTGNWKLENIRDRAKLVIIILQHNVTPKLVAMIRFIILYNRPVMQFLEI